MPEWRRLSEEALERFAAIPTSGLSDALDKLGLNGSVEGLLPINSGARIAGHALTLSYLPSGVNGGTVGNYLHLAEPGDVIVIDNRGRTDCTVWGNILTEVAKMNGIIGTVIDGVNRDVDESRKIGYPIWARRSHMRTGKDRVAMEAINVPVCLGKVRVEPGDVIVADDNGVVVIPLLRALDVLREADEIGKRENRILNAVRSGVDLAEARAQHGYFSLQAPHDKVSR